MTNMVECISCDTEFDVKSEAGSCPDCGAPHPDGTDENLPDSNPDSGEVECPDCGSIIDADASFCLDCGAELETEESAKPEIECSACDGGKIPEGGDFCISCGEERGGDDDGPADESEPESDETEPIPTDPDPSMRLVTEVDEHQIVDDGTVVVDNNSFGLDARYDAVDIGASETDAKTISREHLMFSVDDGEVILTENGRNETTYNGSELSDGEEVTLADGDKIGLNDVISVTVAMD